jgi:hypothetical protein
MKCSIAAPRTTAHLPSNCSADLGRRHWQRCSHSMESRGVRLCTEAYRLAGSARSNIRDCAGSASVRLHFLLTWAAMTFNPATMTGPHVNGPDEQDARHANQDAPDLWCINPWLTSHMIGAAHSQCIDPAEQARGHAMFAALAEGSAAAIADVGQGGSAAESATPEERHAAPD